MRQVQAGRMLSVGGAAGAVVLTVLAVMAFSRLGQGNPVALPQEPQLPPLLEVAAAKHVLRAPGATIEGQVVRYNAGVVSAFASLAQDYPVTAVSHDAVAFSLDRKASGPVSLAAVHVLPPRRPAEFSAMPVSVASAVEPADGAPALRPEPEPRVLNIPVPGLNLARHAVVRTGEALTATASGAADIVGRGVDAGLGLIGR